MTLVLDNGTGLFKAGYATDTSPSLVVEPIVTKIREKTEPRPCLYVGPINGGRIERQRTPFDDGILISSDLMESVLDHAFIHLDVNKTGFDQMVVTEPMAHPLLAQNILCELAFETYSAPKLALGVDALFAMYHNNPSLLAPSETGSVVVSIGHSSTCVVPVSQNGQPILDHAHRLSVGWQKLSTHMQHITQLKYPEFPHILNAAEYQDMMQQHCYVAQSYASEAHKLLKSPNLDVIVQYSVTKAHQMQISQERVVLTAEEQDKLTSDRSQFIAETVLARTKLDEKANRQNVSNAARKRSETKNRMRVMASLIDEDEDHVRPNGRNKRTRVKQDTKFGDDQADWKVYSDLIKDTPDDIDEDAVSALARLDRILAEHDPLRLHRVPYSAQNTVLHRLASGPPVPIQALDTERLERMHQLRLNIERIRVPEALFSPNLVGVDEAGITDLVQYAVQALANPQAVKIVCTGGGATIPGLTDRLALELTRDLPTHVHLDVTKTVEPYYDAWRGATSAPLNFTSRQEWFETGRLGSCLFSNPH